MTRRWDCLCAGIVVADQVCEPIDALPPPGGLALSPQMTFTIGGCAANVAVDMAKLGLSVGISGAIGDDLFGRALSEMLRQAAVDCTGLGIRSDQSTSVTFVVNVKGEDRRFIHSVGANAAYDASEITDAMLSETRILYVGGYSLLRSLTPARVRELFERARRCGTLTVLDVVLGDGSAAMREQSDWDWLSPVLPQTDFFFPNNDEAARITGTPDPQEQARRLRNAGCSTVVITCGADGALLDGPDGRWHSGIHLVPAVDPTGTGDAFVSGYLFGLLRDAAPVTCLKYGSALGASCVQCVGATTGIPTRDELQAFMARHPLAVEVLA